ncbi:MAG: hypothetical protein J6A38_00240 [Clostridia bacterium]|nr:hypothetical protein [Clostridia bacterium]
MTQDKMRRIITACVSAGTVLLVLLLSFLIYQWITIGVYNKRIDKTKAEIAELEQQIDEQEKDLAFYKSELYLEWKYQELQSLEGKK